MRRIRDDKRQDRGNVEGFPGMQSAALRRCWCSGAGAALFEVVGWRRVCTQLTVADRTWPGQDPHTHTPPCLTCCDPRRGASACSGSSSKRPEIKAKAFLW